MIQHRYLIYIDMICDQCGYRNRLDKEDIEPLQIVACGNCGQILHSAADITEPEQQSVQLAIDVLREKEKNKEL